MRAVDTSAWTSLDALGAAVTDFGAVLLWVCRYALLGTMAGVLLRSVPVALAAAAAYAVVAAGVAATVFSRRDVTA